MLFTKNLTFFRMPPVTGAISRALVEGIIKENRVVLFSKTFCPFCNKVKDRLKSKFIPYKAVELNLGTETEMNNYQDLLKEMTGQRSVPNVFINGTHIGGCDDTLKLDDEGNLLPLGLIRDILLCNFFATNDFRLDKSS